MISSIVQSVAKTASVVPLRNTHDVCVVDSIMKRFAVHYCSNAKWRFSHMVKKIVIGKIKLVSESFGYVICTHKA